MFISTDGRDQMLCIHDMYSHHSAYDSSNFFLAKRKLHGDFCIEQRYGGDQMLCIHDMYSHHSMFISNNCGK